jgi:integrase
MSRPLPETLTLAEGEALLAEAVRSIDAARTPYRHVAAQRDLIMIFTGWYAGLRAFELCKQRVETIDLAKPVLKVIRGKRGKDRNIPISDELLPLLTAWIGDRREGYLFPGPRGKKLAVRTFQVRLDEIAARAGFTKSIHPHLLRHTYATELLHSGSSITDVQTLMGHSDLRTTLIYLHTDVTRLGKNVNRMRSLTSTQD